MLTSRKEEISNTWFNRGRSGGPLRSPSDS